MSHKTDEITYRLEGLACEHCRTAVTQAVSHVAGVENVHVDLAAGRMRVIGHRLDDAVIAAAVAAEGYEVAP